jgi:type IV secretory pathway VirB10-like protein
MSEKKKTDFVVSDRRKFTDEGELRPDAAVQEEAREVNEQQPREAKVESIPQPPPPPSAEKAAEQKRMPEPPSEAQQTAQHGEYQQSNKKLDQLLSEKTGRAMQDYEMTFERLVASLYMTAMLQLGLMAPEGEQPRADILGARQTIDTLALLQEKTKGNLTPSEQSMLQSALFELRMAYLELTNAITRGPQPGAAPPGVPPHK